MLEAQQLTKYYGAARAVADISFCIQPGEVLGCLRPNGSGKSTTVKMLTSLLEPTRGEVLYGGTRIRDNLGYKKRPEPSIFWDADLFRPMVRDFLDTGSRCYRPCER